MFPEAEAKTPVNEIDDMPLPPGVATEEDSHEDSKTPVNEIEEEVTEVLAVDTSQSSQTEERPATPVTGD